MTSPSAASNTRSTGAGRVLLGVLAAALLFLLLDTAFRKSPVYDEIIYPAAGLAYWKTGDFSLNKIHPPLQKLISAVPLLLAGTPIPAGMERQATDEWHFGYSVMFQNLALSHRWIFLSRLPSVLFACLLIAGVYFWLKHRYGFVGGVVGACLLIFDPLILSNGALALNDIFVCTLFFFSVTLFLDALEGSRWKAILCGAALGGATASKFSGFLLIFIFLAIFAFRAYKSQRKWEAMRRLSQQLGLIFLTGLICLLGTYQFKADLLGSALLESVLLRTGQANPGFLLGPIPSNATWYYYPVALLIKTPIPLLILWAYSLFLILRKKWSTTILTFLLVVGATFAAALCSPNHFGVRYLLPMVPFLAILSGIAVHHIKKPEEKWAVGALIGWLAIETFIFHPHHMAYFNELIGGPKQGFKWLDGSNQDWGQDLPTLAEFLRKKNNPSLILSYSGSGAPEAYGIHFQDAFSPAIGSRFRRDTINPVETENEYLAVSARLMADPQLKWLFRWLQNLEPAAFLGYTIFVYDISNDPQAAAALKEMYALMGKREFVERQQNRAIFLQKKLQSSPHHAS